MEVIGEWVIQKQIRIGCTNLKPGWLELILNGGKLNIKGPSGFGSGITENRNVIFSGPIGEVDADRG